MPSQHLSSIVKGISTTITQFLQAQQCTQQAGRALPVWEDSRILQVTCHSVPPQSAQGCSNLCLHCSVHRQAALTCFLTTGWNVACAAAATFCTQQAAALHLL